MIDKERAIRLVESYLAGDGLDRVIYAVDEYSVGWLVFWGPLRSARAGGEPGGPVGGDSHVLVDRHDGSLHYVADAWWPTEGWEDHYLLQTKGVRRPDPLAAEVRELVRSAGVVPAMRHLRRRAPRLGLPEAKAYLAAVRDGAEPPEDLAALTREERTTPFWPVDTLAGPVE
ncbi:hypothetical protein GCM10009639_67500 [Kitasatospora putterlickiae]|uniref:Immunity protein 35 domain-containing protein n=1 Tax=Kitasatospora putterlickiae TaxID=221725 RepID=A0ABN1YHI8_9ACTN